jgi:death-on-curing protein
VPEFLQVLEVLEIHRNQIELYGGADGLRDVGLLLSAVEMPRSGVGGQYFHNDLFEMAAAYLFHIVRNHPFVDGNKRTGLVAAIVFLELNDITIEADDDELTEFVLEVVAGAHEKSAIAARLRQWAGI